MPLIYGGLLFSGLGAVGLKWPRGLAYPLGVMGGLGWASPCSSILKVWWPAARRRGPRLGRPADA